MGDTGWFDEARFGMFVHWGHGSQHGWELSWPMVAGNPVLPACQTVPPAEYHASAATFSPEPGAPRQWAELAAETGMGYAVLTARHHDGFSLWPTASQPDYSIAATPYRGDIVGEYVEAMRGAGLRVGLYYSLPDWHHPDYPAFTGEEPYQYVAYPRPPAEAWERYLEHVKVQLRELLTGYGAIDVLWFDGSWERSAKEWRTDELRDLIRSIQPDTLVNDRLPGHGDFETPEQFVPPAPPEHRWETCMTMNRSWGWVPTDTEWKSGRELVHTLAETAGRSGNLLLNVGPTGDGSLAAEQVERLRVVAGWMERHGDAIRGTTAGLEPWQFYGPTTRNGDTIYLHLLSRPYDSVPVRGLPIRRIRSVRDLGTGTTLAHRSRASVLDELLSADPLGEVTIDVPAAVVGDLATVIAIEIDPG